MEPNLKSDLYEFFRATESRLSRKEAEFSGAGFSFGDARVVGELEEELLDLVGWTFMRWGRLRGAAQFDAVLLLELFRAVDVRLEEKPVSVVDDLEAELVGLCATAVIAWVRLRRVTGTL